MRDVRAGEIRAGIAAAILFHGKKFFAMLRVQHADLPVFCIQSAGGTGKTRRRNAVKKVHAVLHSFEQIFGLTDAKQVARLLFGKFFVAPADGAVQVVLVETAADTEAVEFCAAGSAHGGDFLCRAAAQFLVAAALNDAEQCLSFRILLRMMKIQTALGPRMRAHERLFLIPTLLRGRCAFVECENNIGTKIVLDLDRFFRSEIMQRTVDVRAEGNAVVAHGCKLRHAVVRAGAFGDLMRGVGRMQNFGNTFAVSDAERKYLKAPRVRHHRPVPAHELVQSAGFGNELVARLKIQMVRIAQRDLPAHILQHFRRHSLHRTFRAHGNKGRCHHRSMRSFQNAGAPKRSVDLFFDREFTRHRN